MSSNDETITIKIKELNVEKVIQPNYKNMNDPDQGGHKTVVIGKPGCFAKGTKVLKFNGQISNVEDIKIGEQIMGDDSTCRNVLELCNNVDTMYKIVIDNLDPIVVNENHILSLKHFETENVIDIFLKDFIDKPEEFQKSYRWYKTKVEFDEKDTLIEPYIFGYSLNSPNFSPEMLLYYIKSEYNDVTENKNDYLCQLGNMVCDGIDVSFKINSYKNRMKLLAGFLDSAKTESCFEVRYNEKIDEPFSVTHISEKIIDDITFIARSLGFHSYKVVDEGIFRCYIIGPLSSIPTIKLLRDCGLPNVNLFNFKVERLDTDEYFGFVLDGNHRFLLEDFSVVHNTGKTTLIASLLYAKKHIFPVAMAMSGSEDSNGFYRRILPSTFIYNGYNEEKIKDFIRRQKISKEHLPNPWAVILLDDCTDDTKIFNKPLQNGMYKRGRHWKMWYILSLQYSLDIKPVIRTNVDGVFILREPVLKMRRKLWENYASIVPDFTLFCAIMDQLTEDYHAIYIHNAAKSNNWQECIYWYKAPITPSDFKFGCQDYWDFHHARYNTNYIETFGDC